MVMKSRRKRTLVTRIGITMERGEDVDVNVTNVQLLM
jgi:hypothetical protein